MVTLSDELGSRLGTATGSHAAQGGEKTTAHQNQGEKPLPLAWTHSSLLTKLNIACAAKEKCLKLPYHRAGEEAWIRD